MAQNIITAGGAADPGIINSGGNDGTLVLQVGPAGGKVNAISLAADGTPTLVKTPNVSTAQSTVRVQNANGYGSTNTAIKRYATTLNSQGSDITYADSATLGASFTINTAGVYAMSMVFNGPLNMTGGISLNTTQPTTSIASITAADRIAYVQNYGANASSTCGTTMYLAAGAVVRPHTDAGATGSAAIEQFIITRVA